MNNWEFVKERWKDCIFFRTIRDGVMFYLIIAILILMGVLSIK